MSEAIALRALFACKVLQFVDPMQRKRPQFLAWRSPQQDPHGICSQASESAPWVPLVAGMDTTECSGDAAAAFVKSRIAEGWLVSVDPS